MTVCTAKLMYVKSFRKSFRKIFEKVLYKNKI